LAARGREGCAPALWQQWKQHSIGVDVSWNYTVCAGSEQGNIRSTCLRLLLSQARAAASVDAGPAVTMLCPSLLQTSPGNRNTHMTAGLPPRTPTGIPQGQQ
jgi:hypothetical protein